MKIFQTEYIIGNQLINNKVYPDTYGSTICAETIEDAKKLCKHRRLEERIITKGSKTTQKDFKYIYNFKHKDFMHWLCFLGYVALKSGYKTDKIFGDKGIIHELIHVITFSTKDLQQCEIDKQLVIDNYINLCKDLGFLQK